MTAAAATFRVALQRAFMETATCEDFRMTVLSLLPPGVEVLQVRITDGAPGEPVNWVSVVAVTR